MSSGREEAVALDERDPLASFRQRFVFDPDVVYLDGNSLGCLPRATDERLRSAIAEGWGRRGIRGWEEGWMELPVSVAGFVASRILA